MLKAGILWLLLAFGLTSCTRESDGAITHRGRDGRPVQWIYRIDKESYKIAIDTNEDGRLDVIKTYKDGEVVKIESDRNFDGRTDLVQVYLHGELISEVHDDDFDGRPEKIEKFRHGKLAIVERDPQELGYIDIVEYYDDAGKLIRREVRRKSPASARFLRCQRRKLNRARLARPGLFEQICALYRF